MRINTYVCLRSSVVLLALIAGAALGVASAQQKLLLPDSPGAVAAQRVVEVRLVQEQAPSPSPPSQTESQPAKTQKPVGTAAAESPATTGVAASNPAGAAVAPAKQRRVRSFLIKVGALVGAGVAVGTVVALSSASPSRPPGSR